ncbi:MAG TPA: DUF1553 domain-containing protein, partial [Verrucomicrobiae bacterium]|nr:DUF1553 domain-containing protein [Verrucomicrobiae bacterium]
DEEFRSAAIVDRVNTTMAVWMGTSIGCAQCHTHKYDPITQEEYFRFYAILNNTEDADRPDESPVLKLFTSQQKKERKLVANKIGLLEKKLTTSSPELVKGFNSWESAYPREAAWTTLTLTKGACTEESSAATTGDSIISKVKGTGTSSYQLEFPLDKESITGLRLELFRTNGAAAAQSALTRLTAKVLPPKASVGGRFLRIDLPGKDKILSLAEVQVFTDKENIAPNGEATQSSTELDAPGKLAIDGNTDGDFKEKSVTHTKASENPWWELDLKSIQEIGRIVIWNRTDNALQKRLAGFRITILNDQRETLWEREVKDAPSPSLALSADGTRTIAFVGAYASSSTGSKDLANLLKGDGKLGWAPSSEASPWIIALTEQEFIPEAGSKLVLTLEETVQAKEMSEDHGKLLESFKVSLSSNAVFPKYARTPSDLLAALATNSAARDAGKSEELTKFYLRTVAPELQPERDQLARVSKQLEEIKPYSVPILRELAGDQRRQTRLQYRGNFMDLGQEVEAGVPAAFPPLPKDMPPNRLALAQWLVDENNPLTARVAVNRFWEQIFGIGLVRTSEEFGAQGDTPSNPELLDWLATEFVAQKWDVKRFIKLLVTSAAYRQSSRVTPELAERDPDNRLLARGPRFRMTAETLRDQALFVAGLLSPKMKGPSVKPPQPASGLSAAFGSSVDWKTSEGEDRFRRGLYTEWRRTSPYPSMSTFDAPNREVCTIRRNRTNTPLQALVTLNDPVFIEAAQALARRMIQDGASVAERVRRGFQICLARQPSQKELNRLAVLFGEALADFAKNDSDQARLMASLDGKNTTPETVELAAWTTVANVLLNLDETLMKR